jgi:hypothetical protein
MFIEALVSQEGGGIFDILWLILPILLCLILMGQGRRGGGKGDAAQETVSESWYTTQDTETTYKVIEAAAVLHNFSVRPSPPFPTLPHVSTQGSSPVASYLRIEL